MGNRACATDAQEIIWIMKRGKMIDASLWTTRLVHPNAHASAWCCTSNIED